MMREPPGEARDPRTGGPFTLPPRVAAVSEAAAVSELGAVSEAAEAASATRASDRYLGALVDGRYRVERVLGVGGMGTVYLCRRVVLDRPFALKVLNRSFAQRKDLTERLLAEARASTLVVSPHVVDVVDVGQMPDGALYIVMEYVDGESLKTLMRRRPLPLVRALALARQIAEGLAAAHTARIVHRDLKPDNVFVTQVKGEDFVKIIDFGVAKFECLDVRITAQGAVCGTPHYMSPEQATGDLIDHRSDVYAFGVLLYELVTGALPFMGATPQKLMEQHVRAQPEAPSVRCAEPSACPPTLDALILRCLAKRREDRYGSMSEVAAELATLSASVRPSGMLEPRVAAAQENVTTLIDAPAAPRRRRSHARAAVEASLAGSFIVAASLTALAALDGDGGAALLEEGGMRGAVEASSVPHPVSVVLSPIDAEVFAGARSLGRMPLTVPVLPGQVLELEARRAGYQPYRFGIDGRTARVEVQMIPAREPGCEQSGHR
jgi:serine/threonine-protein kinase